MACILHVIGEAFEPDSFLETASLDPYAVWRKGDLKSQGSKYEKVLTSGGFKCYASDAEELEDQIEETIGFLEQNRADFERLKDVAAVEYRTLDFGHFLRMGQNDVVSQSDGLPHRLLKLCGELGLEIELSLYPREDSFIWRELAAREEEDGSQ